MRMVRHNYHLLGAIMIVAAAASLAQAGQSSVKKIRTLVLCHVESEGMKPVDYHTGARIDEAMARKGAKTVDTDKLAKMSYQEAVDRFQTAGVSVVDFKDFYNAYESGQKGALDKMGADLDSAGKKQDEAAAAGIQSGMDAAAAKNPAMAAAQAAAKDGGPKGYAGGALTDEQTAAILNNPNIPEAAKDAIRKSLASGQRLNTGAAPVMGIPPGMRDGTAASRFNAGQKNGEATMNMMNGMSDTMLSAMKANGQPSCPVGSRRGQSRRNDFFWRTLDKVGAEGFAVLALNTERPESGSSAYQAKTNAYSHAVQNDRYHVPGLGLDVAFYDKDGNKVFEGFGAKAPSALIKGKNSTELQLSYEGALPEVTAELAKKLYR